MLVKIIKNWDSPNLIRQTPGSSGTWGGVQFTLDQAAECDAVIVLNRVPEEISIHCSPSNIWALMQEPYVRGKFDWMVKQHKQYAHFFTHHLKGNDVNGKYVRSHPAVPWHVEKTYDELREIETPDKLKAISWITSNKNKFPGHKQRMEFLRSIQSSSLPVDIYGRGINFIQDKWDGLATYRYSLAIENSCSTDYWTEKIADCFLSMTVPIYYGCTNIEEYFPEESFIRIDINNPGEALQIIANTLKTDDWEKRRPALNKARSMVLEQYQFFPQVKKYIEKYYRESQKKDLILTPFNKRKGIFQELRNQVSRFSPRT